MNSLSIVILIGAFISVSHGFLTNCNESVSLPCTLLMTPYEDAYQNVFLSLLDPLLKFVYHLGLTPNETKPEEIEAENVRIQTLVGSGTIETFFKKLLGLDRGYERRVILVPSLDNNTDLSNFTTTGLTDKLTWQDLYDANQPEKNSFLKKLRNLFGLKDHKKLKHSN